VAERRIERFCRDHHVSRFVPSDFPSVYAVLCALDEADVTSGGRGLCEWGSGFGVVACMAAWLGYDACGIELNADLVEAAVELADDFEVSVGFACGDFSPDGESGYAELGLGPDDFDVIFAYPWPDEQRLVADVFERHAREGAVLLTYHGGDDIVVRRKRRTKRAR
jgi:hypothetical protein